MPGFKFIVEPVHGEISIDERFLPIVDSEPFQRLRRIRQLSLASLVYPGAVHNRFLHSLGVYHISKVFDSEELSLYALLHDIGHGPFSHAFEVAVKLAGKTFDHDLEMLRRAKLALESSSFSLKDLKRGIKEYGELVHGDLGIDRQDYLIRDSYFTGVRIGFLEWKRLCRLMQICDGEVIIERKALDIAEHLFIARFLLGSAVYYHKTVLIAEHMFYLALKYLLESYSVKELAELDDFKLANLLREDEGIAGKIWRKIEQRQLFKMVFVSKSRDEAIEAYEKLKAEIGEENVVFGERGRWQKPIKTKLINDQSLIEASALIRALFEEDKQRSYYFVAVAPEFRKFFQK